MDGEINVLALVKDDERYVFLYTDENRTNVLRTLGRWASNPELSLSWYDAAVLSQKVRQEPSSVPADNVTYRAALPPHKLPRF